MTYINKAFTPSRFAAVVVAGCAIAAQTGVAHAQARHAADMHFSVSAGTVLPIVMGNRLSSTGSYSGEHFIARVSDSGADHSDLPQGTKVYGHVTSAISKHENQFGFLGIAFDRVVLPNGQSYPIRAVPASVSGSAVDVNSSGQVVAQSQEKKTAIKDTAIGAGAGLLGDLLLNHGKVNLTHVLAGAGAGYGVSTINKDKQNNQNVTIPKGSIIGMKFVDSLHTAGKY